MSPYIILWGKEEVRIHEVEDHSKSDKNLEVYRSILLDKELIGNIDKNYLNMTHHFLASVNISHVKVKGKST